MLRVMNVCWCLYWSAAVAIDLLEKMLLFHPKHLIKYTDALTHEYLAPYHDATDEPVAEEKFDWIFESADLAVDKWKIVMYVFESPIDVC